MSGSSQVLLAPRALPSCALVTGATGLLGSNLCATLLWRTAARVVAPIRTKHSAADAGRTIVDELHARGMVVADIELLMARLTLVPLDDVTHVDALNALCKQHDVDTLVHAAGSVDYFNTAVLEEVNVKFTNNLLQVAKAVGIARFVFVSTAFSAGYTEDTIGEVLHAAPLKDPTDYTRSKRDAEACVADSGVPFLILRPSIVIGAASDGRYVGKPYGVYQFYAAGERLLIDKYQPEIHVVAPAAPLPALHQDALQEAFFAALAWVKDDSIVNVASARGALPTMRDVLDLWVEHTVPFEKVFVYEDVALVPMAALSRRLRMWAEFSAVNTEIATHTWHFDTSTLDTLRARMQFVDTTRATLSQCLQWWLKRSERVAHYIARHADRRDLKTEYIVVK